MLNQQYRANYRVEGDQLLVEVVEVNPHDYRKKVRMKNDAKAKRQKTHRGLTWRIWRILRELQDLSQNELSELAWIPQFTISAIERDRINLGVERAKVLGRTLRCHPAVLVFPGLDVAAEAVA